MDNPAPKGAFHHSKIKQKMENALMVFAGVFLIIILIMTVFIEVMYWKSFFNFIKALFSLIIKKILQ